MKRERDDDVIGLKRELFADADDETPLRAPKRRRIVDDDDDDSDIEALPAKMRDELQSVAQQSSKSASSRVPSTKPSDLSAMFGRGSVRQLSAVSPAKRASSFDKKLFAKNNLGSKDEAMEDYQPDDQVANDGNGDASTGRGSKSMESSFNFCALECRNRSEAAPFDMTERTMTGDQQRVREKLAALDANVRAVGSEEGGWCERHSWTGNIRDAQKRKPDHPDYDKTTLYVPPKLLSDTRGTKTGGLSPFQRQFWSIKMANYDVVIFFKKGKFYEMYDCDADIGHKELGLNFTKGGRVDMRCCGVPEQAFDKHTARLIDLGYKVGRVEQTETANAAEKRKNSTGSSSSICERSLVRILTKATVTEDGLLRDHRARYVLAITEGEQDIGFTESDQSTSIEDASVHESGTKTMGCCYVDVASGCINISQFDDDFRLSRTERLLTFLRPQELIVDLSVASSRLKNIVKWSSRSNEAELCDLSRKKGFPNMTATWLAKYLLTKSAPDTLKQEYEKVCKHMRKFSLSCKAFGAMAQHLKSLIIDKETLSLGNYILFPETKDNEEMTEGGQEEISLPIASSAHLRMDAPTLQNLEVLCSSVDGSEKGSLLSFVDQAQTPAGRRLIRKWIAEPLVSSAAIEDRLQAIEDIHSIDDIDGGRTIRDILKQLKTKRDLERALPKLHKQATVNDAAVMFDDTNKRRVRDFILVLRSLQDSLCALETLSEAMESTRPKSKRLRWLCTVGCGIPSDALDKLNFFLGEAFDLERAQRDGEIVPRSGAIASYDQARAALDEVEDELELELKKWRHNLGDKSIKFYHRGKEPYQIEVKLDTLRERGTPNEFEVVSESKSVKRFYTSRVKGWVRQQVEAQELFDSASSSVARDMVGQFDAEYGTWAAVSSACAEIDALMGLAYASRDDGSGVMCRPKILENDHPVGVVRGEGLRHPILAKGSNSFVSNDVVLGGGDAPEIMVLTGPNAGGKSTLARQVAVAVILAQMGCYVAAESFELRPCEDIFVRMGASDDLARGRSTFMVEMEEVGNILKNANSRSLVIADEVGRGTSTHDGYAVAYASLDYIARVSKCLTVFSTHYSHLGEDIVSQGRKGGRCEAGLYEMGAVVDEKSKKITFLYKLQRGASGDSRGVYCARVAGIAAPVAEDAERAALEFDSSLEKRLLESKFEGLNTALAGGDADGMLALQQM